MTKQRLRILKTLLFFIIPEMHIVEQKIKFFKECSLIYHMMQK